eukprot:c21763_g1_i1 orf=143-1642(+)
MSASSTEPFRRLVKLVARAFYDDDTSNKEHKAKPEKSDNRGIAVVVLDALTRRQWVKEDDLAKDLHLHPKQLRRTLRVLEEEALIVREHRRETSKGVKAYNAAIAATRDGQTGQREGEDKQKAHTHSYCCLDYAQVFDIVRYRIHRAKKKIKDELEDRNAIQQYLCPNASCGRRYSALDALLLVSPFDENFHCENCNGELVAESDKLAAEELGEGEDNARRRRREKLKDMLERMDKQFKPLLDQLARVKDLTPPDYGTLVAWEARAIAAGRTSGDALSNLPKVAHGQGTAGTPLPFLGETKVEVSLAGAEIKEEDSKEDAMGGTLKVLPPWMIREGMNLTAEQRGLVKQEVKLEEGTLFTGPTAPDIKPAEDSKEVAQQRLQEEYLKAYYAALMQRQQEASFMVDNTAVAAQPFAVETGNSRGRHVGAKSGREDAEEEEEEVEWEETSGPDAHEGAVVLQDASHKGLPEQDSSAGDGRAVDDTVEQQAEDNDDEDIDWE